MKGLKQKARFGQFAGVLISTASIAWIIYKFDLKQVLGEFETARYKYLIPVFLFLVVNFILRYRRWGTIFAKGTALRGWDLFSSMMIGYLANNIMPARAGEFVRAYILGKRSGISKSTILATIIVERLADLVVLLILLAVFLMIFPVPDWLFRAGMIVGVLSAVTFTFMITLNFFGHRLLKWVSNSLSFLPVRMVNTFEELGNRFVIGIKGLHTKKQITGFVIYTIIIWTFESLSVWFVAQSFSLYLTVGGALFILLSIGLGTMIPSSPGYIGTYEFFVINALAVINITGSSSLGFTLMLHLIMIAGTSLLGAVCLVSSGDSLFQMKPKATT